MASSSGSAKIGGTSVVAASSITYINAPCCPVPMPSRLFVTIGGTASGSAVVDWSDEIKGFTGPGTVGGCEFTVFIECLPDGQWDWRIMPVLPTSPTANGTFSSLSVSCDPVDMFANGNWQIETGSSCGISDGDPLTIEVN